MVGSRISCTLTKGASFPKVRSDIKQIHSNHLVSGFQLSALSKQAAPSSNPNRLFPEVRTLLKLFPDVFCMWDRTTANSLSWCFLEFCSKLLFFPQFVFNGTFFSLCNKIHLGKTKRLPTRWKQLIPACVLSFHISLLDPYSLLPSDLVNWWINC